VDVYDARSTRARFVYVFARNRTGSLTGIYPNRPRETIERFTYRIVDGQNVFKREPGHFPVLDDISVHGHVLEDNGYVFLRDGTWHAPSSQSKYRCVLSAR
jgi:hypothetical protein